MAQHHSAFRRLRTLTRVLAGAVLAPGVLSAAELRVGPGEAFDQPAAALARARDGDTILITPRADAKAYEKVALMVRTPGLTIRSAGKTRVKLSGEGFDYSGRGPTPRAIIQFDPQASGCLLEGFEIFGAHNTSHNGAGIRINQASQITVRDCDIHANDMGVMSNGNGTPQTAAGQLFERCLIHHNGDKEEPGYNHNLYLGGTSVTILGCEIHSSLTGHNIKSRAHLTRVIACYVHDSANRELDLVDAKGDTDAKDSDAILIGNIIVKAPRMGGNKSVIHFGQDGGKGRDGTIWLLHNTIVTPYISPVIDLTTAQTTRAVVINSIVTDAGAGPTNQVLVAGKDLAGRIELRNNWLSNGFSVAGADATDNVVAPRGTSIAWADAKAGDYRLSRREEAIVSRGLPWARLPGALAKPQVQARAPDGVVRVREDAQAPTIGAATWPDPPKP